MNIRDICFISVFVAMIVALSQLAIPLIGGVPITLQTFIIPLAGTILGAKNGAIAAFIYILLGAVGIPVFAGFTGGIGRLTGPTGGFILSYPFMAFAAGYGADRGKRLYLALGLVAGSIINLSMGMVHFAIFMEVPLYSAFFTTVAPFILLEAIKMVFVFILTPKIRRILKTIDFR